MTPDEFDVVYSRIAKLVEHADDPVLVRDRLILRAIQLVDLATALELIDEAGRVPADSELRSAAAPGEAVNQLEHTPTTGAVSRS